MRNTATTPRASPHEGSEDRIGRFMNSPSASPRGSKSHHGSGVLRDNMGVSKVTGMSLSAGLHLGFVELVEGLDSLYNILKDPGGSREEDEQQSLRYRTRNLLQTKGTQAVYWMQLMNELSAFASKDLAKLSQALRLKNNILNAMNKGEKTGLVAEHRVDEQDLNIPAFYNSLRVLFESFKSEALTIENLQKGIENLINERDKLWEAKITNLHIRYGKIIDDLKFAYFQELEKAETSSSAKQNNADMDIENMDRSQFDIDDLFQRVMHMGSSAIDETGLDPLSPRQNGEDETAPKRSPKKESLLDSPKTGGSGKEKYHGTAQSLKVIVPPKLATIDLPTFYDGNEDIFEKSGTLTSPARDPINQTVHDLNVYQTNGSNRGCLSSALNLCSHPGQVLHSKANDGKSYRFHITYPQCEFQIPAHVIERYARDVLFKNHEIIPSDDPRLAARRDEDSARFARDETDGRVNVNVIAPEKQNSEEFMEITAEKKSSVHDDGEEKETPLLDVPSENGKTQPHTIDGTGGNKSEKNESGSEVDKRKKGQDKNGRKTPSTSGRKSSRSSATSVPTNSRTSLKIPTGSTRKPSGVGSSKSIATSSRKLSGSK